MAARTIAIRITLDNRDALNAAKAQVLLTRELSAVTDKHTQLQNGLTNSFIKGNLAARAISIGFNLAKDALFSLIKTGIQFEYTMAKIEAVSGSSKLAMQGLEGTIRGLALSSNQSQIEIAKTALEMGKMGLSSYQVEKALSGVVLLAKALDEGLVETGETVVGVMNAYNMSVSEINKITNQLAFTVKESALDMEKFGVAFSYAGGTAAQAGVSFEELQGAMDILSNAGIRSSTIGTGLRRIISDLADENSKAAKAAGGTIASYGGLANTLEALKNKHLETADYTAIFGRTATSVAAIATKYAGVMANLAKQTGEVGDTVGPMSETMNNTLLGSLNGITSAWKDLGIEISKSTGFLSTFAQFIDKVLTSVGKSFKQEALLEEFKKRRPEAFEKDRQAIYDKSSLAGVPIRFTRMIATGSPINDSEVMNEGKYFQRFALEYPKILKKEKDKENSIELLQESFGKQKLPKGWDPAKYSAGQMGINPEDTAMYNYIQKLWGTDEAGFKAVKDKAVMNWASKAEASQIGDPFDLDSLEDKKIKAHKSDFMSEGFKRTLRDQFESNDITSEINGGGQIGSGFKKDKIKPFVPEKVNETEETKKAWRDIDALISKSKSDVGLFLVSMNDGLNNTNKSLEATKLGFDAIGGSVNILSQNLAGALFFEKDPFKDFGESFKNLAKSFVAELIAMQLRILAFKATLAIFGLFTGGAGAAAGAGMLDIVKPIGNLAASGTDQVVTKPTMFMAGESGKERVTVTPRAKMSSDRSGGGITVNIQGSVLNGAEFTEAVEMAQKRLRGRAV